MTRAAAKQQQSSVSGEFGVSAATSGVLVSGEIGGGAPKRASDSISGEIGAVTSTPGPRTRSGPTASASVIIPSLTTKSDVDAPAPSSEKTSNPVAQASSPTFIDSIFDEEDEEDEPSGDVEDREDTVEIDDEAEVVIDEEPVEQSAALPRIIDDEDGDSSEIPEDTLLIVEEDVDAAEVSDSVVIEAEVSEPPPPPTAPPRAPKAAPPAPPSPPPRGKRPRPPATRAKPRQPPPSRDQKPRKIWHEEAFTEHYAAIEPNDHDVSAELDVAFIVESAGLAPTMSILDVGCGNGHHLCMLRKHGFTDLHGVDSSLSQVMRASQKAEKIGGGINLFQGDMRSLPTDRTYDVVLCLGTTFGYFDDEQNRQVLVGLREQLAPGGRLVLQVLNGAHFANILPCRSWWQGRACLVLDVADMNPFQSRVQIHRTVVFEDGRQFEHRMSIRAYALHELGRMITEAGLRIAELSGSRDTRGRFYNVSSPDLWIVAERRPD